MTTGTDVYLYLEYLEYYLSGDLDAFHLLCRHAESQEEQDAIKKIPVMTASGSFNPDRKKNQQLLATSFDEHVPKYFRSTIPHALSLFATVDILGYLLSDDKDYKNTSKNFKKFFESSLLKSKEIKILINIFRHGMSHGYFPKLGLGISYHSSNPQKKIFFKNKADRIVLNVNFLEEIIIERIKSIKNDSSLYIKMGDQYSHLMHTYNTELKKSIEELEKIL